MAAHSSRVSTSTHTSFRSHTTLSSTNAIPSTTQSALPVAPADLPPQALKILGLTVGFSLLFYVCALRWACKRARVYPKTINTNVGIRVQRSAPIVYFFIILGGLTETSLASYLFIQYLYHGNYPSILVRNTVGVLLGIAAGTTIIAALYAVLFLHASWSMLPVSSVGSHALWIMMTMIIWVVGATTVFMSLPQVRQDNCAGLAYCLQLRTLLYTAAGEVGILLFSLVIVFSLAYQSLLRRR